LQVLFYPTVFIIPEGIYLECLRKLCHQIGVPTDKIHYEIMFLPSDTHMAQAARTIQAMEKVKSRMAQLMNGLRIFLILDDVWCHEDVELFNFGEEMSSSFTLFITTRTLDMFPSSGACWIDIPLLRPEDAVSFFFLESGRGETLPSDEEFHIAAKIVKKCGYLPLAIRIAAKVARAFPDFIHSENGLESIPNHIVLTRLGQSHHVTAVEQTVANLLHRSFSIVTNADVCHAVKICFGAMAAVFYMEDNLRPWVSQDAVVMLWRKLFEEDENLIPYLPKLGKYRLYTMKDIVKLLKIMGLIDTRIGKQGRNPVERAEVQIHHDLLWEYGKTVATEFQRRRRGFDIASIESDFDIMVVEWNTAMIECYKNKINSTTEIGSDSVSESESDCESEADPYLYCDGHMLCWLPHHMIKGRKVNEALNLLMNKKFLKDRTEFLGILKGTKQHIFDIQTLQKMDNFRVSDDGTQLNVSCLEKSKLIAVLLLINHLLLSMNPTLFSEETQIEIGRSLVILGVSEQGFALWQESLECFKRALKIFQDAGLEESHPYILSTTEQIETYFFFLMWLEPEDSPLCLRLKHPQKFIDYDYGPSGLPLELSYPPNKGIVQINDFIGRNSFGDKNGLIYSCLGPKEGSTRVVRQGNLLHCVEGKGFLRFYLSDGDGAFICWSHSEEQKNEKSSWIIRNDGRISPLQNPKLCIAASPYPYLSLVAKDSPSCIIFKNHEDLRTSQDDNKKGKKKNISLELSSHPNLGIVTRPRKPMVEIGFFSVVLLFIGTAESSLFASFTKDQEIVFDAFDGFVLRCLGNILEEGTGLQATRDNCDRPRKGQQFQVNKNGSISPIEAPHLVLGFPEVTVPDNSILDKMKADARKIASKSIGSLGSEHDLLNEEYQKLLKGFYWV